MSKRLMLQGLLAILLSVVIAACGGDGDDPAPTQVRASPPAPATAPTVAAPVQASAGAGRVVRIVNQDTGGSGEYAFNPAALNFKVGESVTFEVTAETEFHTFTVDDLGIDESLGAGETATFDYTFDKAGTFELICLVHPQMTGTITVQ